VVLLWTEDRIPSRGKSAKDETTQKWNPGQKGILGLLTKGERVSEGETRKNGKRRADKRKELGPLLAKRKGNTQRCKIEE